MAVRLVAVSLLLTAFVTPPVRAGQPATDLFENQVRPLLLKACQECHGPAKQRSSLRVDSRAALLRGGDGGPALVPGDPAKSLLIQAVLHQGELRMPPRGKLTADEIKALTRWVEAGAPWTGENQAAPLRSGPISDRDRAFWSFQPIRNPALPRVRDTAWPLSPVDAFILARLEAAGLGPASPADRPTLIRRVSFDLIGLPPTPEEVDAFVADSSPDAFARVVDRLLASPHYGERWGRHWLDVVRYADTAGETADYPVPQAYLYRNYVIDSFNIDRPYNTFLREQLAGDILARSGPSERYAEQVIATGFLAIARRFGFDPENYQHLTLQDSIDTLGQAVLGLSLGCARCHDNKYDPVSRQDYYALYGILDSTRYPYPGSEKNRRQADFVPLVPPDQGTRRTSEFAQTVAALAGEVKQLDGQSKALTGQLQAPPGGQKPSAELASIRERLAQVNAARAEKQRRLEELNRAGPYPLGYAVIDGKAQDARIHRRGEPLDLGDRVPRRFLEILGGDRLPEKETGSGRLQLAEWLVRPENPLTARVIVNRLWQHHFGTGLVATPNDYGNRGQRPSHPELLDYLAWRLQLEGWSLKAIHRLILLSRTYQQGSQASPQTLQADPDNRLLSHYPRRRLDAESIRDALLLLGGNLDRSRGGPHPFPPPSQWGFTQHAPFSAVYDTNQRSVYLMTQRLKRHPFLALFDGADANASTPQRAPTTVPPQALFFLNDPLVHAQAEAFAARLLAAPAQERERVTLAHRQALGRSPSPAELQDALEFLARYRERLTAGGVAPARVEAQTWAALARSLFARNEFIFID